ncbi:MFS transporter [Streptomyces sp. NBC_00365]|uniref:MFS transporter n=1 Tax=Streptomyces sp. NBC_00365 TaxID=2975726 RepID=UPI00224D0F6A|nr:MFS transporter [Streptomyces sp. NBC_00365]MCX5087437.1 MFS transporter [Streptomyces sp. NBC_00365]
MSSTTTDTGDIAATGGAMPYPKRWAAAFVMILAALLDMIDGSIVNTALPSIGTGLKATSADLQWTVSAYMLGFAATLIIAGHLGDRYGHKKLFMTGVSAFALASLASAVATSAGMLVASRGIQGVAAAIVLPQILASFRTMFDGEERGKAFALYGAIAGISTAVGVLLGGVLTDWDLFGWGWRTIFAINLPLAVLVLVLGPKWIPTSRDRSFTGRIDLVGNLVLAAGLVAIVLPLVQGRSNGWPLWGWICLAVGILAIAVLTVSEKKRGIEHPLLPTSLFRKPAFSAGLLIQLLFYGGMSGFMLVFTIWLQTGQGYTPTQAGLLMVAFSAGSILAAPAVDLLVAKLGRIVLILGALVMAGGLFWVRRAAQDSAAFHTGAWPLVPGLFLAGVGLIFLIIPLVNTILSTVPGRLAGGASGILSTAQQFGGALGVAVIGNVFFSHADKGLTSAITHAGPWAIAAYVLCAVLCLALPRKAVGNQTEPAL